MTPRETTGRFVNANYINAAHADRSTWEKYYHRITGSAKQLCQALRELPFDKIVRREKRCAHTRSMRVQSIPGPSPGSIGISSRPASGHNTRV